MPRITALEPDPRRPGALRLAVDGKVFCTVHEDAPVRGLAVGAEWDEPRQAHAGQAADEEGAWRAALRALERRSFAVAELRRRLQQKGHPPAAVDYAVGRAQAAGLVDDAAFARRFVESRAARGRGPSRLRRDLQVLGVDRRHIEAALTRAHGKIEGPGGVAELLAINPHTLRARMRRLGVDWRRHRSR